MDNKYQLRKIKGLRNRIILEIILYFRSPVPIQRGQQPQQQNNQQPYTFQQQNTSGQRIVQVTQQQVRLLFGFTGQNLKYT